MIGADKIAVQWLVVSALLIRGKTLIIMSSILSAAFVAARRIYVSAEN